MLRSENSLDGWRSLNGNVSLKIHLPGPLYNLNADETLSKVMDEKAGYSCLSSNHLERARAVSHFILTLLL